MRDRQLEQNTFVKKQLEYEEKVRKPLVQEEARAARVREKIEQKDLKVETILNENEKLKRDVSHQRAEAHSKKLKLQDMISKVKK